jgi:hypothetical protein
MFSGRGDTGVVRVVDKRDDGSGVGGVWRWCIDSFDNGGEESCWGTFKGSEVGEVTEVSPVVVPLWDRSCAY